MRPTRLQVQGLTAYRNPIEIDFSGLDLFAVTGPTGAGKSSIVDAIAYALFGQVPRVGTRVGELISQGADSLKVSLEFQANGSDYRIHRQSGRRAQKAPQLERLDEATGEWIAEEPDRVRDVNRFIEELLRMDFKAFIRSVLLPQGQFQEFLAGDRDERRKVLDSLLDLGIYGAMQQRANTLAAAETDEARRIRERLETELANATPDAVKAAEKRLAELVQSAKEVIGTRQALESGLLAASKLIEAATRQKEAETAVARAEKELAKSRELLDTGEARLAAIEEKAESVRKDIAEVSYDSELHLRLTQALEIAQQLDRVAQRVEKLAAEVADAKGSAETLGVSATQAKAVLKQSRTAAAEAVQRWEHARTEHQAGALRSALKPGDACPVCGQPIVDLPAGEPVALESARADRDEAVAAAERAQQQVQNVERQVALAEQKLDSVAIQLRDASDEHKKAAAQLEEVLPGKKATTPEIAAQVRGLVDARSRAAALAKEEESLTAEREKQSQAIVEARNGVAGLEAEAKAHAGESAAAARAAAEARGGLENEAKEHGWDEVISGLEGGKDVGRVLNGLVSEVRSTESRVHQEIGAAEARIEQVKRAIELAEGFRAAEKEHALKATLARDLASLLRADRLPAFIREQELRALARDGSARLREISGDRYDFQVEGQDFLIVDRWNGGETRSVRTLSGGETFLASLALALALADRLPGLMTGVEGSSLESLFIDEGFSNLDDETLDTVASALEVLGQDRRRLIGVITHLQALADRMPARIIVHKTQAGSTVTVE